MKSKTGMFMSIAAVALAASASFGATVVDDGIKDGVHGYTPKRYVRPPEPEVRERLEWFKDQKLALMMHWGIYSTIGSSSWSLSDADADVFRIADR